ncbi:hypothetical protein FRC04_007201 [Tulasnella sp. 424]|nr:hypothetical protein FRC04_007201 [Tulasnella sp. 424]KAG8974637.1 hypothetical protein FRC05_007114 [Tulasnella sp. 425]
MSEDIEMAESFPSINSSKGKSVIQGEFGFGQGDSHSVGENAEPIKERTRVESDDVAGNPSSFGMVDQPSAHPGAPFGEYAEELQGDLVVPALPILSGGYANIYLGIWRSPEGTLTDIAVKTLKPIRPSSMSRRPDPIELQQRRENRLKREVAVWTRLIHPNVHPLLGFRTRPEPCLISPWCQNGDLGDYLHNNPNVSRPDKIQL